MSSVAEQRKIVMQLRSEYGIHREKVSKCINDIIGYYAENVDKDFLINGFPNRKDNPFQEKGTCSIF